MRGLTLDAARCEALERERKDIQTRTQEMQAKRNALSKQIGAAKGRGEDASALLAEVVGIGDETKRLEGELDRVQAGLRNFLLDLLQGSVRVVTGVLAKVNPDLFRVQTPTSVVGVRGTDFIVETQAAR